MFARALRRPCRGERWGRWRSSRARREAARQVSRLRTTSAIRPGRSSVCQSPAAYDSPKPRPGERASRRKTLFDVTVTTIGSPVPARYSARPGAAARARRARAGRAPGSRRARRREHRSCGRREARRSTSVTASPIPRRARTSACGRTARASARASPLAGGSGRSPAAASAGSGSARGRGSRRSKGVAVR